MGTRVTHHGVLPDLGTGKVVRFEPGGYQQVGAAAPRVEVRAEHRLIEQEHGPSVVHHSPEQGASRATPARVELLTGSFADVPEAPAGKQGQTYDSGGGSKVFIHPAKSAPIDTVGEVVEGDGAPPATPRLGLAGGPRPDPSPPEGPEVVLPPVELDEPARKVPPEEVVPEAPGPGEREGDDRFEGKGEPA